MTTIATLADLLALPIPSFLEHSYLIILGRPPDEDGKGVYTRHLSRGLSKYHVLRSLISSTEHKELYGDLLSTTTGDEEFLQLAFRRHLGRQPDSSGSAAYLAALASGAARSILLASIEQSSEAALVAPRREALLTEIHAFVTEEHLARKSINPLKCFSFLARRMGQLEWTLSATQLQIGRLEQLISDLKASLPDLYQVPATTPPSITVPPPSPLRPAPPPAASAYAARLLDSIKYSTSAQR